MNGHKIFSFRQALIFLLIPIIFIACDSDYTPEGWNREAVAAALTASVNADSIESCVRWLEAMGTRYALAGNGRSIASKIKKRFISMGYEDTRLDSFRLVYTSGGVSFDGWQYNVIATLEGREYPDSVCILGAHYDDISEPASRFQVAPGANDNASGVAAMMETARVMKKKHFAPDKTIRFIAFGAEETGLHGSADYARKVSREGEKINLMLNNDMIAYESWNDPANWRVNIIDYDNSHSVRYEAERICNIFTELDFINDNTYSHYSDSYPFVAAGYKALFFTSWKFDNNYHTVNDLADACNFDYCREVTKISCAMLVFNTWKP